MVLRFEFAEELLKFDFHHSNKSYRAVLSCGAVYCAVTYPITLYKVVLAFESVDEILVYDLSYDSYTVGSILSCGTVYYAIQSASNDCVAI